MSNENYEKALEYYNNGDYDKAMVLFKVAAEFDDNAECKLGNMYRFGKGVPKDYEKALYWYHRSAKKGNAFAESNIGSMYRFGEGVNKDYMIAFEWYMKSAKKGNEYAQQNIGSMYRFGEGVAKNAQQAFFWYNKSAGQGNMFAQSNLGDMYFLGDGVEHNYNKAFFWYSKAVQQGYSFAKYKLGILYYHGYGVDRNYEKAFTLLCEYEDDSFLVFSKSGEMFYYLAECYYNGYGVKANWQKAKEYYQRAIDNGYNCRYSLEMVKRDLHEYDDSKGIKAYADSVIEKKLFAPDMLALIKKDLERDFGEYWTQLKDNAQKALISGVFSYINFYSLGEEIYKSLDFTPCITAMAKALETELAEFFFKHYLAFLKNKGASPTEFSENQCFINVTQDGEEEIYFFANNDETYRFSLGSLWYIIEVKTELPTDIEIVGRSPSYRKKGRGITTISKYAIEFANELFKEDAFSENNREKEIVNYLIDLATDVKDIKKIRNPAAHSDTMTCAQAEVCGDYLIKVRKLICNILSKIKDEYK